MHPTRTCRFISMLLPLTATPALAQWWWPPNQCQITPSAPTPGQSVTVTLAGSWPDSCIPDGAQISVAGQDINFSVFAPGAPACLAVITPWSQSLSAPLPAPGTYTVSATLYQGTAVYGPNTLCSVTVLAPAVTIAMANPPASNPYGFGVFRDVLQNTTAGLTAQGIGVAGTPNEDTVAYDLIRVTFSGAPVPAPTPANIAVACTDIAADGPGDCPAITNVTGAGAGPYAITLGAGIPTRECITFTFAGTAAGQKLQYQSLPGDVNFNGVTTGQDALALIAAINDGSAATPSVLARYDINRNGSVTGQDVLRLIQLLNGGAGVSPPAGFNGLTVAPCPP